MAFRFQVFFQFRQGTPAAISNLSSKNRSFGSSKSCSNSDQDKSPSPWNPFWLDFLRFFGVKFEVRFLYTSKWSGSKKDGWKNFCRFGDRWNIRLYMFSLALKIMDDFLKYNLMKYITHLRLEYLLTFGCKYSSPFQKARLGCTTHHTKLMSFNRSFSMSNWFFRKSPSQQLRCRKLRTKTELQEQNPVTNRYHPLHSMTIFPHNSQHPEKKTSVFQPGRFRKTFEKKTSKKNTYQVIQAVTFSSPNVGGHDSPTKVTFSQNCQVPWGIFIFQKKKDSGTPSLKYLIFRRSLPRSWSIFLLPALLTAGQQTLVYQRAKKTDLR